MKYYKQYMDRQTLPPDFWEKQPKPRSKNRWRRWAALAACCVVLAGLGLHMTSPVETTAVQLPPAETQLPVPDKRQIVRLPQLAFQDVREERFQEDAAPVLPAPVEGVMRYEMVSRAEVAELFGGEIPEMLGWGDFAITSSTNDPESSELYFSAQAEDFQFDLFWKQEEIPDVAGEEGAVTLFRGTEVRGAQPAEDLYEIWFLTPEGLGVFYRVKGTNGPERAAALAWVMLG